MDGVDVDKGRLPLAEAKAEAAIVQANVPVVKEQILGSLFKQNIGLIATLDKMEAGWHPVSDQFVSQMKEQNPDLYKLLMRQEDAKNDILREEGEEKGKYVIADFHEQMLEANKENPDLLDEALSGEAVRRTKSKGINDETRNHLFRYGNSLLDQRKLSSLGINGFSFDADKSMASELKYQQGKNK